MNSLATEHYENRNIPIFPPNGGIPEVLACVILDVKLLDNGIIVCYYSKLEVPR